MRISDWSSDVCSSDVTKHHDHVGAFDALVHIDVWGRAHAIDRGRHQRRRGDDADACAKGGERQDVRTGDAAVEHIAADGDGQSLDPAFAAADRSEEHTSELQSLMRISYAVFCLKKKKKL